MSVSKIVNIEKNNIFAFWESHNDMSAYLKLCIDTWYRNIPNCEIHIINYDNINNYIAGVYDIDLLKKIPLAMQSDVISAAVLEKFGGVFLDVDCIVTNNIFEIFNKIYGNKLVAFGSNKSKSIHLAVLYSRVPNNPILKEWRTESQKRLNDIPEIIRWDYFGNSIINPLIANLKYADSFYIIERSISGNILESTVLESYDIKNAALGYKDFYFNKFIKLDFDIIGLIKCGIVSLHNSWTPKKYKDITNIDFFLENKLPVIDLLKYALNYDAPPVSINSNIIMLEVGIDNFLRSENIIFKKRYFKDKLVFDFKVSNIKFAFDLCIDNQIEMNVVLRDVKDISKFKNLKVYQFLDNKSKTILVNDIQEAGNIILDFYRYCKETYNTKLNTNFPKEGVRDNVFVDLQRFSIINNTLYIEGIGIVIGQSSQAYEDIDFKLRLEGQNRYVKQLAKLNKISLSEEYSIDYSIDYSKSYFTTRNGKGLNIEEINIGTYDVFIEITSNGVRYTQPLRALNEIVVANRDYYFKVDSEGSLLSIISK